MRSRTPLTSPQYSPDIQTNEQDALTNANIVKKESMTYCRQVQDWWLCYDNLKFLNHKKKSKSYCGVTMLVRIERAQEDPSSHGRRALLTANK